MKKEKKIKEKKKVEGGIKPKWKLWMTIACVILGVGLVAGITIMAVILARGGTDEKPVVPQSIAFTYQEDLYNISNSQLEVTEDFTLTITTPTEGVNRLEVELSLSVPEGQTLRYSTVDNVEYVSNSIVSVPRYVNINQPFTVKLETSELVDSEGNKIYDKDNNRVNWITGGLTSIIAKTTQNNEAEVISINVAIDVPVYSTETIVINSEGRQTDQIILGEHFHVETIYIPSASQYMFSDDKRYGDLNNENIRYKRSFYQTTSSEITPQYDENGYDMSYIAGEETTDKLTITGYTFKNAYDQIAAVELSDTTGSDFYQRILTILAQDNFGVISSEDISLGEASIGSFNVTNQTLSMNSSQPIRLYLNNPQISDAKFLGVSIRATSDQPGQQGELIEYMLKNVAINFEFNGVDPTLEGESQLLQISGGDVVNVDGKTYYMPFSNVQNRNYSYWDITARDYLQEGESITINVVLLIEKEDETFEIYENTLGDVIYTVSLSITQHFEQAVSWADGEEINVLLDYYEDGQIIPSNIDLSNKTSVPSSNIYKDVIFFAYFGDGELEQLTQTAQTILGNSVINLEQSGQYPTSSGSIYLFALDGYNLSIYNAGEFDLYFATIITVNGAPEIDDTGRYQISQMVSSPVQVSISKALNDDSITNKEIDTSNYDIEGEDITYIDQGNSNIFTLRFTVAAEMVEVFQSELNNGYMSIIIRDTQNNDITSYFNGQENPLFTINEETSEGIIEYNLVLSEGVTLNDDVYLQDFALVYRNTELSREIIWRGQVEKAICLYAPKAERIVISQPVGYLYSNYITASEQNKNESISRTEVQQTLNTDSIALNIKVGEQQFTTINQFLTALLGEDFGYVVITDQHGQTDTLLGEWEFVFVTDNTEGINLNGQNINFTTANNSVVSLALKTTDSAGIVSNNVANGNVITFNVNSTGITRAEAQNSANLDPYNSDDMQEVSNFAEINVRKYGAASDENKKIDLANYVTYYAGENKYTNIAFTLSASYFISTSEDNLQALFGENGMLTLYNGDTAIYYDDLNSSTVITSFTINKDFTSSRTLNFTVKDANSNTSAFSYSFNLTLSANLSIANNVDYGNASKLYANTSVELSNAVTFNNNNNSIKTLGKFYNGTYYIVIAEGEERAGYKVSQDKTGAVGEIKDGNILFYDFWDVEQKSFSVLFTPQGDNIIAASIVLTFNVSRNLSIALAKDTYYLFDAADNNSLGNFVNYSRANSKDSIDGLEIIGSFDQYLTLDNGNIVKEEGQLLFGYNQKVLTCELAIAIKVDNNVYNDIANFTINIELFNASATSVYDYIATKQLSSSQADGNKVYNAQTQIVDGIEYIVLTSASWKLNQTINVVENNNPFNIKLSQKDLNGVYKTNIYEVVGDEGALSLKPQSKMLAGLDDNTYYLVATFGSESNGYDVYMYIPMIISSIGYDYVAYSKDITGEIASNEKLARALTRITHVENEGAENEQTYTGAVALIKNKIYDEINAGEMTQILQGYTLSDYFGERPNKAGLHVLGELSYTVEYFPIATSDDIATDERIVKSIDHDPKQVDGTSKANVDLYLNHLTTEQDKFYLVLSLTLQNTSDSVKLYYVLKVNPDIVGEASKYAYNGSSEYIEDTSKPIDLDETFSNITLNEGYTRFNVSKNITLISTLKESEETGKESEEVLLDELTINATSEMTIEFTVEQQETEKTVRETFSKNSNETIDLNDKDNYFSGLLAGSVVNIKILSGRGSISYNGKEVFRNLSFAQEVSSVEIDGEVLTDKNIWSQFVGIEFQGSDMYVTPISQKEMTITIKRSYDNTSDSLTDLSVIGLEQYYKFIVNASTHNYSVDISGDNLTQDQQGNYIWSISNDDYADTTFNLTIYLKENAEAGSAHTGTTIWNELEISLTEGSAGVDIKEFKYVNTASGNGEFTLTRQDYLNSDREIRFTLYTKYGYLATLIVKLEANAEYSLQDEYSQGEINGGTEPQFTDVFNISLDNTSTDAYSAAVDFTGKGSGFIAFDSDNKKFKVADLFEDVDVTLNITITFNGTDDSQNDTPAQQFTFTQSFTLKANVVLKDKVTGPVVIAGEEFDFTKDNGNGTINFFNSAPTLENSADTSSDSSAKNGLPNRTIEYTGSTPSSAVKNNSDCIYTNTDTNTNMIATEQVNGVTNVTVTVTVTLGFGASSQSKTFTYSFTIYPSVKLQPNYPKPNKADNLENEYLDDGATFDKIVANDIVDGKIVNNFFNHNAIFSNVTRLQVFQGKVENGEVNYDDIITNLNLDNLTILVTTLNNASLSSDNGTKHYNEGESIPTNSNITFHLGTYNGEGYTDNGNPSKVEFTLRYNKVEIKYSVIIQPSALNVNILNSRYNADGNYTSENQNETETETETESKQVTYDILYVDKTSTSNLFGRNRIFEVSVNSGISINGNYYVIFGKQNENGAYTEYYASYPQYITPAAGGIGAYYLDLGYSLPKDLTYLGLYASSAFESQCLMTNEDGLLSVNQNHENFKNSDGTTVNNGTVVDALSNMTNVDYNKAVFSSTRLTSRVELVYGGYYVDYSFYGNNINVAEGADVGSPFTIDPNSVELDKIYATNPLTSFNRNDGSENSLKEFTATYYYMTCLDIDVEDQINGSAGNINTVTVNDEEGSLVELVGIIHPTSGEHVTAADFGAGRAQLSFDIISYNKDTSLGDTVAQGYLDNYIATYHLNGFTLFYNDNSDYNYMSYSARLNSSNSAYDYTLFANGAKLTGDYVLGKITYQSNGFIKEYYVVIKIKPDYIVTFDGSSENATKDETRGVISNIDNVHDVSDLSTIGQTTTYNQFILTGDKNTDSSATEKSIISIKHRFGSNTSVELSTANFTLTMPGEKLIDGQTYNDETNFTQKLSNAMNASSGWTEYNGVLTYLQSEDLGSTKRTATKITGANEVIFGSQYFYIQGEDRYGYKFEVYFSLQSANPLPRVKQGGERMNLVELSYIDVGANFETVSVSKEGENGKYEYKVSSKPTSPSSIGGVTMIEVQGIEAYLFNEEYGKGTETGAVEPAKYYLDKKTASEGGGYNAKGDEGDMWTDEYKKYFSPALIEYITVQNVTFYDLDGNSLSFLSGSGTATELSPVKNPDAQGSGTSQTTKEGGTTEDTSASEYTLATASELYYNFHDGYEAREGYPIPVKEGTSQQAEADGGTSGGDGEEEPAPYYALQIPRFVDTDIFGNGSTADVTMTIKLKYEKGKTTEYYDLRVDVTILREVTIETADKDAIRDGFAFDVAKEFNISSDEKPDSTGFDIKDHTEFVNDTLEVLVDPTSNSTFEIKVERDGQTFTGVGQASNSSSIHRTSYLSISDIIGTNVRKDDKVTIIPQDDNAEYYYITNSNNGVVNNHFEVTSGENGYQLKPVEPASGTIDYQNQNYDFNISTIQKDAIYVEHASRLENKFYTVTKYYVVNVNFDPEDNNTQSGGLQEYMSYRTQKTYEVTGYYYNITGKTTDEIIKRITSTDGGNTSEFGEWAGGIRATTRTANGTESDAGTISNNYLTFTLNKTADSGISGGTLGSGNASIDSKSGTITFNEYFTYNQYIKVVIGLRVSGPDRDINSSDPGEATYNFSPIRLGWADDYNANTDLINTVVNGSQSTIRMKTGSTVGSLPEPSLEGYTFLGWSLTAEGEILGNDTVLIPGTTYYAIFKEIATN